jgi:hypothetical protein
MQHPIPLEKFLQTLISRHRVKLGATLKARVRPIVEM